MKKNGLDNLKFFGFLLLLGIATYYFLDFLPAYTKLAIVFLILPSVFFIFRKNESIDRKKLLVTLLLGIIATVVWDSIAINLNVWGFPQENTIGYLLGIPWEEYIFALFFITISIGTYTSLPKFKEHKVFNTPRFKTQLILALVFILQIGALAFIFSGNENSYLVWLSVLAIFPSLFFMFRRGEKVDEIRLIISIFLIALVTVVIDYIFIPGGAWYHHNDAILGRLGLVPIEDILFGIFNAIVVLGFYTSVPKDHPLIGRWKT